MRTGSKLLFAALTATVFMSFAVGTAPARRFELSNQRFLAIWTSLELIVSGFSPVLCPVTLEGSFHSRTLSKLSGQLIGYITNATVRNPCTNGMATVLTATLPWHLRYLSFIGRLPGITGITAQLIGAAFRIETGGQVCLTRTTAAGPGVGIVELTAGVARTLRADETRLIPMNQGDVCDFFNLEGSFRGTAEVFLQRSLTTRITVRLVQ